MRRLLTFGLLALLPVVGRAQDDGDDRQPPMFVVADADSRVTLLGSVHLLPDDAFPLPPAVEAAYDAAGVVAFELDLDEAQAGAPSMVLAATDEPGVGAVLSPEQKAAFDAALADLGVPAGAFDAFEPWFAGLTLGVLTLQQSGLAGADGVDSYFFERAKADGKERVALETLALQAATFDDLATPDQVAFLMAGLADGVDGSVALFEAMVDAWASGDDEGLIEAVSAGMSASPAVREALLVARNRAWVPQIEALLARDEDALVVVGVGHLVGPDSVVAMLRAAGHTVTRQ